MNAFLKESIQAAQIKYKQYDDARRKEASLQVGDLVYLKLQPYLQLYVAIRRYLKLSHKYFMPFTVIARVGPVAYKLELPEKSQVHPIFHISLLKNRIGSKYVVSTELPKIGQDVQFLVYPVKILQRRMVKKNNRDVTQWLI